MPSSYIEYPILYHQCCSFPPASPLAITLCDICIPSSPMNTFAFAYTSSAPRLRQIPLSLASHSSPFSFSHLPFCVYLIFPNFNMIPKLPNMRSQCWPHVPAGFHATTDDPDAFHSYSGEIPQANYPEHADLYTIQGPTVFTPEERRRHLQYRPTFYMLPGGREDIDNIGVNPRSYGYLEKRVYSV
ncbi:hypothetical protein FIBSPDRAFT_329118 [Athelia psychrophila]|uniref:Uncharacterized protein n=1 Tax=Athelia psychrophila TaxID=1759441 RepID=A0A167WKJ5_9AGAM|nr:hypothetical protein FIBSPDRAFT_329118 [Fibularhizoctonia sp. CBS 109695]